MITLNWQVQMNNKWCTQRIRPSKILQIILVLISWNINKIKSIAQWPPRDKMVIPLNNIKLCSQQIMTWIGLSILLGKGHPNLQDIRKLLKKRPMRIIMQLSHQLMMLWGRCKGSMIQERLSAQSILQYKLIQPSIQKLVQPLSLIIYKIISRRELTETKGYVSWKLKIKNYKMKSTKCIEFKSNSKWAPNNTRHLKEVSIVIGNLTSL